MTSTWAALAAAVFVAALMFALKWAELSQKLDTDLPALWDPPRCGIGGCGKPFVAYFTGHPSGSLPVCSDHADRLTRREPFDQELAPGTDLGRLNLDAEG